MKTMRLTGQELRPIRGSVAGALLCVGLCGGQAFAESGLDRRLDAVIDRWIATERIVGATVIVAQDGEIVYRRAAGHADREAGIPAQEDTIYRHASLTKIIVSATALALVEAGKLSLDDRVADWLACFTPSLPDGSPAEITIRQLMTHTAGLSYTFLEEPGNVYEREEIPQGLEASDMTLEQAMCRLASVPLFYEPGTNWRYSVAIDVLGAVIEKASRMTLAQAVGHYVTGPLGMEDTAFVVRDTGRLAAAYRDGAGKAVRMRPDLDTIPLGESGVPVSPARALDPDAWPSGGGGMSGTADDYLRFLEAIRKGGAPILSPRSARLLTGHRIGALRAWTEGEGWGHSLGAAVLLDPAAAGTPQAAGTWQWGGAYGSHWFVDPMAELTVVVLTNTSVAGMTGNFPTEIRAAIYNAGTP